MVSEGHVFGASYHRDAQILVYAVPDPRAVIAENRQQRQADDGTGGKPSHEQVTNNLSLFLAHRLFVDPRSHVALIEQQEGRLQRLQLCRPPGPCC